MVTTSCDGAPRMGRNGKRTPIVRSLKTHPGNPRYFTNDGTSAVYLTGSHTWENLQNRFIGGDSQFDYDDYLHLLEQWHHNYIRLWAWEQAAWAPWTSEKIIFDPLPYLRTGPGKALDEKPKFDLKRFNQAYFDRLRSRVEKAQNQGFYVGIMLFNGWSVGTKLGHSGNPWKGHPFHRDNNINGIDGDTDGDGEGRELHSLTVPAVTKLQEAYVRKVIETVNHLDNVLYEVANESHEHSLNWQNHIVKYIHATERSLPKQHPVLLTSPYAYKNPRGGDLNVALFGSVAEAISPNHVGGYFEDPPPNDGTKIVLNDSDHLCGICGDHLWVWKSFTRGLNPIFMDPLNDRRWVTARQAMGDTLAYAERMDLAAMSPRPELCSTQYCLVNPGSAYLIYLPSGGGVEVDLSDTAPQTPFSVEWFEPRTGDVISAPTIYSTRIASFSSPFRNDAVLYLHVDNL